MPRTPTRLSSSSSAAAAALAVLLLSLLAARPARATPQLPGGWPRSVNLLASLAERHAAVLSDADLATVVCSAKTTAGTCSLMVLGSDNVTRVVGEPLALSDGYAFRDVAVARVDDNTAFVCFTSDVPSACALITRDAFGLKPAYARTDELCSQPGQCYDMNVAPIQQPFDATATLGVGVVCFSDDATGSAGCQLLVAAPSGAKSGAASTLTLGASLSVSSAKMLGIPGFTSLSPTQLMLCWIDTSTKLTAPLPDGVFAAGVGMCRVMATDAASRLSLQWLSAALTFNGKAPTLMLAATTMGVSSTTSKAVALVCFVTGQYDGLCSGMTWIDRANSLYVTSTTEFGPAWSVVAMEMVTLSASAGVAALCFTEAVSDTCMVIMLDGNGVVSVGENDLTFDDTGVFYRNIPAAIANPDPSAVGAYLATAVQLTTANAFSAFAIQSPFVQNALVLPTFGTATAQPPTASDALRALSCSNVVLGEMATGRYCVATAAALAGIKSAPTPQPAAYCNQLTQAQCEQRSDGCSYLGSLLKCQPKTFCGVTTLNDCNNLVVQYGNKCVWNTQTGKCVTSVPVTCTAYKTAAQCTAASSISSTCIWISTAVGCQSKPYCKYSTQASCVASTGCAWVANQCGVKAS